MSEMETSRPTLAIIGGGAAGMMAAYHAAQLGVRVLLLERTGRLGKKLRITGKGRCNVTNDCQTQEFLNNVRTNPRFLYAALDRFSPADTQAFFEDRGVPLKTERGRRVFPVSDKAGDIVGAMADACHRAGVEIIYERVRSLHLENGALRGVCTEGGTYPADAVIVCTGGKSYPLTGSDGDGYTLAKQAGHTIVPPKPSLVPITVKGSICPELQGLSLKNVALRIIDRQSQKTVYDDFGEMMFTHFGITGPMVLSASSHLHDIADGKYDARIDLKPALDEKTLDARLLSDFEKYRNKDFCHALDDLLPKKLIPVIIRESGIDGRAKVNAITREQRKALLSLLKGFPLSLSGFRPIEEAIVTAGGVSVKEINPKTMESKKLPGLYFAGEVIDVDAYTGGYNLQIAFSTAVLAGESAAIAVQAESD